MAAWTAIHTSIDGSLSTLSKEILFDITLRYFPNLLYPVAVVYPTEFIFSLSFQLVIFKNTVILVQFVCIVSIAWARDSGVGLNKETAESSSTLLLG